MTAAEKSASIAKFNDEKSNINVMVLNQRCGSAGLNLHYCCNYGIQVQYPWNFGTAGQMRGRVVRVGQTKPVTWTVLHTLDSVYDFQEHKAAKKEVQALLTELPFPGWLEPHKKLCTLLAYEVLRLLWSQPFNRFVWEELHPKMIQDFNSVETRMFAHFYQLLAKFLLNIDYATVEDGQLQELLEGLNKYIDVVPTTYAQDLESKLVQRSKDLEWNYVYALVVGDKDEWAATQRSRHAEYEFGSTTKKRKIFEPVVQPSPSKKPRKSKKEEEPADELD